ncbi:MAG: lysozyme [Betaproteobacteria bacterium]
MNLDLATELCRRFEGFRSKPYLCPAGVATIGYGSTYYPGGRKVTLQDEPVNEAKARAMLVHELLETYAPGVIRQCPVLITLAVSTSDWRKLNAIVDFAYNLGVGRLQTSTLKRKINSQDWPGAAEQLALWVRGGGRVLPGLVARRKAEAQLLT